MDIWGRLKAQWVGSEEVFQATTLDYVFSVRIQPTPPSIRAGLPSVLLKRRPDLVAAEHQVLDAFRLEEAAAERALLPSIALTLDGGHLSDGLRSLLRLKPGCELHGLLRHAALHVAAQRVRRSVDIGSDQGRMPPIRA